MLLLLCLLAGLVATVTGACVAPFRAVGEGCYYFSIEDFVYLPWDEAREYCMSMGSDGDLAMLDHVCDDFRNLATYIRLQDSITGYYYAHWIGARGIGDSWYWVDGSSFSAESPYWHTGFPLTTSGCAAMDMFMDRDYARVHVTELFNNYNQPFICQDYSTALQQ